MQGIYKIVNPSNKIYIGQSTDIEKRIKRYRYLNCKKQVLLYNSIKKYGWENHTVEIIEMVEYECNLLERETYWKIYYKVLEIPSLCCRIDGKFGTSSIETREKIKQSTLLYWKNIDTNEYNNRCFKLKETYKNPELRSEISDRLKGRKLTDDHIKNLILSQNSDDTKGKRSKSLKEFWSNMSQDEYKKICEKQKEVQSRPEVKEKISKNNCSKRPEVKEKQRQSALKRKKEKCTYCNKECDPGNLKKHHNDNCKFNLQLPE